MGAIMPRIDAPIRLSQNHSSLVKNLTIYGLHHPLCPGKPLVYQHFVSGMDFA
jgi:hypothetical protein